ncbi:MAG: DUF4476 domain-containing protein [Myxococcales bacterium]|nr:DUF4476 domain-containing protein [Myxococcales bacterium]
MPRPAAFALCALVLAVLAPAAAFADPDVTLEVQGISARELRSMAEPAVVDRKAMETRIDVLAADLATLDRMLELVRDRRERQTLKDQLTTLSTRIDALRAEVRAGAPVRVERHFDRRGRDRDRDRDREAAPVVAAPPAPATGAQMTRLQQSLNEASFRNDKIRVLRLAAPTMYFTTAQAKQIAEAFSFSSDKVEVLAMLYPRLVDPENSHTLFSSLPHASDRRKLEEKINEMNGQPPAAQ